MIVHVDLQWPAAIEVPDQKTARGADQGDRSANNCRSAVDVAAGAISQEDIYRIFLGWIARLGVEDDIVDSVSVQVPDGRLTHEGVLPESHR